MIVPMNYRRILLISIAASAFPHAAFADPAQSFANMAPRNFSPPAFFHAPDPGIPMDIPTQSLPIGPTIQQAPSLSLPVLPPSATTAPFSGSVIPTDQLPFRNGIGIKGGGFGGTLGRARTLPVTLIADVHENGLPAGLYLLNPPKEISFSNEFGTFTVSAKSRVLIAATPKAISIYDVHDTKHGAVTWVCGNQQLHLLPGHQLTVTSDAKAPLAEMNPLSLIPHSALQPIHSGAKQQAFAASFSIAGAIGVIQPLQHDEVVLKAAVIQHLTSGSSRQTP